MKYFPFYVQNFFGYYLPITRKFSENTIDSYRYAFLDLIQFLKEEKKDFETMEITDFNYELISKFIGYLQKKELKISSINTKLAVMKSFATFLSYNLDNIEECLKIKKFKPLKDEMHYPKYYSQEEIAILLQHIASENKDNYKKLCIFTILYDGALRVSELCNLKRKDIKITKNNTSIFIEESKNGMSRTVLVGKASTSIIEKYLKENPLELEEPLFKNSFGKCYSRSGIYKMLKRTIRDIKKKNENKIYFEISPFPHILRHSKSTHLLDAGVDINVIKVFLGHKHLKSTEVYTHVSKKKLEEVLSKNTLKTTTKIHRSKKEKNDLESWLRNNL